MPRVYRCCTSPFKPVTHVIFDMNGTIFDTEMISQKALRAICEEYDKEYLDSLEAEVTGKMLYDMADVFIENLELPITREEFHDKYHVFTSDLLPDCEYKPGVEKLIRHLHAHEVPIAVATSCYEESVKIKFSKKQEIFDMFHHVVCAETDPEVKEGKPSPEIYLICASRFPDSPNPEKCLVFEDSFNGLQAALAAGMQTIMIPDERVPYEQWKLATLRLVSFDFFMPEMFGLPSFNAPVKTEKEPELVDVTHKLTFSTSGTGNNLNSNISGSGSEQLLPESEKETEIKSENL